MITPNGAKWFKKQLRAVGLTGAVVRLQDNRIPAGFSAYYTRIVVENEDNAGNTARIAVVTPSGTLTFHYFASFAADVPQVLTDTIIPVDTFEQLVIDVTGSTTADGLAAYLIGYVVPTGN